MTPYDPETYWNARARQHATDPVRAACLDDADENRCIDSIQRHLLRAAFRRLQERTTLQGRTVLDHGCGSGRWISFLRAYGLVYSGADIAEEMLAIAHRLHPDADLRRIDGNRLPYPDESFDFISSVAVVHHNSYEAQDGIIAEMARVLRPGGRLILFEGLGNQDARDTNYYPRPLHNWIELARPHRLSCTWHRGATYMLLGPLAKRVESLRTLLTRVDALVDPYLLSFLPRRYHTRAVMLFERTPG